MMAEVVIAHGAQGGSNGISRQKLQQPRPLDVGALSHVASIVKHDAQRVKPAHEYQQCDRVQPSSGVPQDPPDGSDDEPVNDGIAQKARHASDAKLRRRARYEVARYEVARHEVARHGVARYGVAWCGVAR